MEILPILSAMRRNKVGAVLVAMQMAVTLAILCNALFIIQRRAKGGPATDQSSLDEANVLAISNQWVGNPPDESALVKADLAALRSLPGVVDAAVTNSYPLSDGGSLRTAPSTPSRIRGNRWPCRRSTTPTSTDCRPWASS